MKTRGLFQNNKTLWRLLLIFFVVKIVLFAALPVAYNTLSFCEECRVINFLHSEDASLSVASVFQTWDAQHYLYLADEGYELGHRSNAFYPLFPLLIRLTQYLMFGNALVAGLVLANLFSVVALVLLYLFTKQRFDERVAFWAGLFFIAFPTSFYLHLVYTESLFLMLILGVFYCLYQEKNALLGYVSAFLLPLTRPQGILTAIPALYHLFAKRKQIRGVLYKTFITALCFILGLFTYFLIMYLFSGSTMAGVLAQNQFASNTSIMNLIHPVEWFMRNFMLVEWSLHGLNSSVINRLFFALFLVGLYLIYKYLDRTLFVYALVVGGLTALSGDLTSYPRYLLLVFPLFIALGVRVKNKFAAIAIIVISFIAQVGFLLLHGLNFWFA